MCSNCRARYGFDLGAGCSANMVEAADRYVKGQGCARCAALREECAALMRQAEWAEAELTQARTQLATMRDVPQPQRAPDESKP